MTATKMYRTITSIFESQLIKHCNLFRRLRTKASRVNTLQAVKRLNDLYILFLNQRIGIGHSTRVLADNTRVR